MHNNNQWAGLQVAFWVWLVLASAGWLWRVLQADERFVICRLTETSFTPSPLGFCDDA
jgi:hypothetical protein